MRTGGQVMLQRSVIGSMGVLVAIAGASPTAFGSPVPSFQGLGDMPGSSFLSEAHGISADGSVVVGRSNSASGGQAFRWTAGGGMVGLGDLPGSRFNSWAAAVSADGSVVVGRSESSQSGFPNTEAFRWTAAGGMVAMGDFSGGNFYSGAHAASADGSVIVGFGMSGFGREPFRWTAGGGMVSLGRL
ncbi:MAG: PEP-CTERM sorting domain-containing protein, partial [bacterium]|nr:PEP-CTERM sorting domain-containing protein [bacterium]